VSGLAVAEATGRSFAMHWPRTRHCEAGFRELFTTDWPVLDIEAPDPSLNRHAVHPWPADAGRRLLADPRPHFNVGTYTWLIQPELIQPDDEVALRVGRRSLALLAELNPRPPLSERVAAFTSSRFRPTMIGVHLRRGDYLHLRPHRAGNTREAMAAVDRLLRVAPEAGILVCSDDGATDVDTAAATRPESLREQFASRYGSRVVWTSPRLTEGRSVEAVADAVVDLWLLRRTDAVVGTAGSSFSELAVAGRDVPHLFVDGAVPAYRPFALLAHVPKVHGLALRAYRLASRFRR
jgi:hypothetical protein